MRRRLTLIVVGCLVALCTFTSVGAFTLADNSSGSSSLVGKKNTIQRAWATATTTVSGGQTSWQLGVTSTLSGSGGNSASKTTSSGSISVDSPAGFCIGSPCGLTFTSFHTWDGEWNGHKHYQNSNTKNI